MSRIALLPILLLAACGPTARTGPSDEERRLLAYLTRDPYVVIERTERNENGQLIVITRQGNGAVRYLLAPDDPSKPTLRLRRLDDQSTLDTAPNPTPGSGPVRRGD